MNASIAMVLERKNSGIYSVPVTATVAHAVQEMINRKIGSVLVLNGSALVGIFTERDVLVRVVAADRDPKTTPIAHVMTRDPVTISVNDTIEDVLDLHGGKHYRHLPVVDDGQLLGMISMRDILRWLSDGKSGDPEPFEGSVESDHYA